MIIEKCSQIEFDLCIWTYLGRWGTDVICVSAEMRFCLNHYLVKNVSFLRSLPARGVWIEIAMLNGRQTRNSSLPARGVWIEMWYYFIQTCDYVKSLPARGVWIEIRDSMAPVFQPRRSPQGECGLKSIREIAHGHKILSLPARGVWIEICRLAAWSADCWSLPARGVWIEIVLARRIHGGAYVAPRKGSVD